MELRAIARKNGGTPEGARQGNHNMLSVTEKPEKASLLTKVGSEYITASPDKRAADWLEQQVAKSQDKITTVITDLTPALARVLLNRNAGNRKQRDALAVSYARDMASGRWDMNGEPIIIAKDGTMNDGQHRCLAVGIANVAIPTIFVFGVERETRQTLDQGAGRSLANYLEMDGITHAAHRATVARYIWLYTNTNVVTSSRQANPTKTELREVVEGNKNIIESIKFVDGKKVARLFGGVPFLAFMHLTLRKQNRAAADEFITTLIDGVGMEKGCPILYARNRLMAELGKLSRQLKAELLFKAWNAYRRGETLKQLYLNGGQLPKLEK
jgi:hypothetical protein